MKRSHKSMHILTRYLQKPRFIKTGTNFLVKNITHYDNLFAINQLTSLKKNNKVLFTWETCWRNSHNFFAIALTYVVVPGTDTAQNSHNALRVCL